VIDQNALSSLESCLIIKLDEKKSVDEERSGGGGQEPADFP
jgi:hypothetical protein